MKAKWLIYFVITAVTLGSTVYITSAFASTSRQSQSWLTAGDMMTTLTSLAVPNGNVSKAPAPAWDVLQSSNQMWNMIAFDRINGWLDGLPGVNSYTFSVSEPFDRAEAATLLVAMYGIAFQQESPLTFAEKAGWFHSLPNGSYFTKSTVNTFLQNVSQYVQQNHLHPDYSAVGWSDLNRVPLSAQGGFMAALQYTGSHLGTGVIVHQKWWSGMSIDPDAAITASEAARWIQLFARHAKISELMNHLDISPYLFAQQLSLFHGTGIEDSGATLTSAVAQQILNNLTYVVQGDLPNAAHQFEPMPRKVLLPVKIISQFPELPNGCEVTSLSMLLQFEGVPVTNVTLASQIARAKTPLVEKNGQVVRWGNPNDGFVGHMSSQPGYGVFNGPIAALMKKYLPNNVENLTGDTQQQIIRVLESGRPVEAWTNVYFRPVYNWVSWISDHGPVRATFDEHAVVLVGYGRDSVYLDNPFNGDQAQRVTAQSFWASWRQMGSQAVTVKQNTSSAMQQEEEAY